MAQTPNIVGYVKTHSTECIKQYITYSSGVPQYVYEARANALHGEPCIRTEYVYSSGLMVKMKETQATWDSTYDI